MKSIAFLLLLFGIIFIVIGYIRNEKKYEKKKIIEYRYIPYSLYSEQINNAMQYFRIFETRNNILN